MRTIEIATALKKDYRRARANPRHAQDLPPLFERVVTLLAQDKPLPNNLRDHALVGDWHGYRECHLKPDLLLIYRIEGTDILRLARLGSHAELFGK